MLVQLWGPFNPRSELSQSRALCSSSSICRSSHTWSYLCGHQGCLGVKPFLSSVCCLLPCMQHLTCQSPPKTSGKLKGSEMMKPLRRQLLPGGPSLSTLASNAAAEKDWDIIRGRNCPQCLGGILQISDAPAAARLPLICDIAIDVTPIAVPLKRQPIHCEFWSQVLVRCNNYVAMTSGAVYSQRHA